MTASLSIAPTAAALPVALHAHLRFRYTLLRLLHHMKLFYEEIQIHRNSKQLRCSFRGTYRNHPILPLLLPNYFSFH